jgi:hypothetical protein
MLILISIGFAVLSAGLWLRSAKVSDLKVLKARAEQVTNDAAIKAAFSRG